jgi:hypothetical protein
MPAVRRVSEDERTVKTAHLKPDCSNGSYEAGAFSKDRYAAYLIKARRTPLPKAD